MKNSVKIVLTIVVAILFVLIGSIVGNLPPSNTKGIICLIVFAAFIGAFVAIWKAKKKE
ncbi:MAG: hypothetical protein PUF10_00320 [Bacteroidales bacterium]|nr:hypothetical protein [Bacteroidales bacterium]